MSLQKRCLRVYFKFPFLIIVNFHGFYKFKNKIFTSYITLEKNVFLLNIDNIFIRFNCFFSSKLYAFGFFLFSDYLKVKEKLISFNIIDGNFIPLYCIARDKNYPLSYLDNKVQLVYTKHILKKETGLVSFFNWVVFFPFILLRLL